MSALQTTSITTKVTNQPLASHQHPPPHTKPQSNQTPTQFKHQQITQTKNTKTCRSMMLLLVLLMLEVAALLRQCNQIRQRHAAEADMEEWVDGAGFDVLRVVIVEASTDGGLEVLWGQQWENPIRQVLELQGSDLVEEIPRH
ncbi:hypothetical protein Droror1_Dr00013338 [Drosera rotundifolia]